MRSMINMLNTVEFLRVMRKNEVTEGMRTQIESAFSGMDVSDEMMDKYIEVADKAYDLADFTVK